ncbi:MAG: hypothetical protein JNM93_09555, partial [Bacteriovoracaceae bacterium]|nr:hypothetical protein [Bacteriovoracaceae bacterium]
MKLSLILLLSSFELYAYTPSVESLFRNGANAEVENSNLAANFTVKKIEVSTSEEITSAAAEVANNLNLKNFQNASFKLLYQTKGKNAE